MEQYHKQKFRALVGAGSYVNVIKSVQDKIMAVAGIKPGGLPIINDVLWDVNPIIGYNADKDNAHISLSSSPAVFSKIKEYAV